MEAKDTITNGDQWLNSDEIDRLEKAYLAGIKEVVKWINSRNILSNTETHYGQEWQSQCKEWGLDKEVKDEKQFHPGAVDIL